MPDTNPQPPFDSQAPNSGEIRDRSIRPPGLLPKNTQTYVILGITVVMVGAIAFSGGGSSPTSQTAATTPKAAPVIDPNIARIQEYRDRIDEQARRLAAEQQQLEQAKQALGLPAPVAPQSYYPMTTQPATPAPVPAPPPLPPAPVRDPLEAERERREYESLFASNIALSLRTSSEASPTPAAPPVIPLPSAALTSPETAAPVADVPSQPAADPAKPTLGEVSSRQPIDSALQRAQGKNYRIFEGSIIETVLTNRLEGSFDGPVNAMVTTAVYSHDGQHVLIPQGSRILGEVKRNDTYGQQRLAVVFHRLIMPDGYSVSLDQFQGLSQIGETGLRDQVNHHYMEIFGVSLAIGAIAGLSNVNTSYGLNASSTDAYRQGVTTSLSQSSLRILDRYLNVLPTFTIREGQRIKVILSNDLMLPAYDRHTMPANF